MARFQKCTSLVMATAVVVLLQWGPAAVAARAQAGALGNITGKAADETGGVLPGVTVTATSPALQVPNVTAVTDAEGNYRLRDLPAPGMYRVVFELTGFQTIAFDGVSLTNGFTARIDAAMKVSTVTETVEVSGQSPVVDTVSVAGVSSVNLERIESTPLGLGIQNLLPLAAGGRWGQPAGQPPAHRDVWRCADANAGLRRDQLDNGAPGQYGALPGLLPGGGGVVQNERQ
jgi:Carboxypeptidase regulatory-like domain